MTEQEIIANKPELMMILPKTFICYCSSIITMKQRERHFKTKKHLDYVEKQKKELELEEQTI